MTWHLQSPKAGGDKLINSITQNCGAASEGAGAFAFATSAGVKLLLAQKEVSDFLSAREFLLIVGLDAITDTAAIEQLARAAAKFEKLTVYAFKHTLGGAIFHPKAMWFKTETGGATITGSGNLTSGGLKTNWEAFCIEQVATEAIEGTKAGWLAWLEEHEGNLLPLDHPDVVARAAANKKIKSTILKASKVPEGAPEEEAVVEGAAGAIEEIEAQLALRPVLVAEVPKAKDRWKQINFDKKSFQEFFGVTLGKEKTVKFYPVNNDGSFGNEEIRHAVAVASHNYRFEIGAAANLPYPEEGNPIVIFERLSDDEFSYLLLMPGDHNHQTIQDFLNNSYGKTGNQKLRVTMTAGELALAWPDCPLLK
jgi:HKD family nuclease